MFVNDMLVGIETEKRHDESEKNWVSRGYHKT